MTLTINCGATIERIFDVFDPTSWIARCARIIYTTCAEIVNYQGRRTRELSRLADISWTSAIFSMSRSRNLSSQLALIILSKTLVAQRCLRSIDIIDTHDDEYMGSTYCIHCVPVSVFAWLFWRESLREEKQYPSESQELNLTVISCIVLMNYE